MKGLSLLDKELIWHPFTPLSEGNDPIVIRSAHGVYLETTDGRKIIDAISSWWVNLHGHSNPHIADAVYEQAKTLEHVIFAGFTHEPAIRLANNLKSILPGNLSRVFFSDDGSTSVEVALKIAFQFWYNMGVPKRKVIAIRGAYHGDTFGSMAVGERGIFTDPFKPFLFDVTFIDFPTAENKTAVLGHFREILALGEVAAFIFEPLVQGAAGMRMYSPEILNDLVKEAHEKKVLCIADEVFTGFGRTGKMFACDYLEDVPDIVCVSKGITGGTLPLGVTACSSTVVSAFESSEFSKTFFHGHSYTANPIACAAANASFELLTAEGCQNAIRKISDLHRSFVSRISGHLKVKDARSLGTILALELHTGEESTYSNDLRKKIYPFFLERDILLRPLGNTIYVLPPYVIQESELNKIYSSIDEFLGTL
jgi:adenosylmethionine---8-amino-7-oxononanoate aminotransferase